MFKDNSLLSKFCWIAAYLSIIISVAFYFTHDQLAGIFIGLWVAPLMIIARNADY